MPKVINSNPASRLRSHLLLKILMSCFETVRAMLVASHPLTDGAVGWFSESCNLVNVPPLHVLKNFLVTFVGG